ncbi:MAG: DUF1289 domain-containing protein [Alphaproteobacteria bacterium]|nr:DUF1289 domain-containing protein [Alphaproteobacteria bacterium]
MSDGFVSPCTGVCRLDGATGWCLGCQRSIDEIAAWGEMSVETRRATLLRLAERRAIIRSTRK